MKENYTKGRYTIGSYYYDDALRKQRLYKFLFKDSKGFCHTRKFETIEQAEEYLKSKKDSLIPNQYQIMAGWKVIKIIEIKEER